MKFHLMSYWYLIGIQLLIYGNYVTSQSVTLTSNVTSTSGSRCPDIVQFTCVATDIETTLRWGINSISPFIASYSYDDSDLNNFPVQVTPSKMIPTLVITILSATQSPGNSDVASFMSTLTVSTSQLRDVQRVVCGTLVIEDSIDINLGNISAPPLPPVFNCSLANDARSVVFIWNNNYNTDNEVNKYCVTSSPSSTSCSPMCTVQPDDTYTCSGLQRGLQYNINVSAVNCADQQGETKSVIINTTALNLKPSNVQVTSVYNMSHDLNMVEVMWTPVDNKLSNVCTFNTSLYYIVILDNNQGDHNETRVDSMSQSCDNVTCSVNISVPQPRGVYSVFIRAGNVLGESNSSLIPTQISSSTSLLLAPSFEFANCITNITCNSSLEDGQCQVMVYTGSSIELVYTTSGPLNTSFALPVLNANTQYSLAVRVAIDLSQDIQVQTTFKTGEFDGRLLNSHIVLITMGVLFLFTAICICLISTIIFLGFHGRFDSMYQCLITVIAVTNGVLELLSVILWIAMGIHVVVENNTCDLIWQRSRDGLITSAFVFSLLSLITCTAYLIFTMVIFQFRYQQKGVMSSYDDIKDHLPPNVRDDQGMQEGVRVHKASLFKKPKAKYDEYKHKQEAPIEIQQMQKNVGDTDGSKQQEHQKGTDDQKLPDIPQHVNEAYGT